MNPVITIDGPSGVGKGSTSKRIAKVLGWRFLDSGAIYRTFALYVQQQRERGNGVSDEILAQNLPVYFQDEDVFLGEEKVNQLIRTEGVAREASLLASNPVVRKNLLQRQRDFATKEGLVADGRDMGTVVFPKAPLKIFLTASAEERAKRRVLQLQLQSQPSDYAQILALIEQRDKSDKERANSPLFPADDAISIDNSNLSIDAVVEQILVLVRQKGLLEYS